MPRAQRPKDPNSEGHILLALQAFHKGQFKSLHAAAHAYDVQYTTLVDRAKGKKARQDCLPNSCKLTSTKESALENWAISANERGLPPKITMVQEMAQLLLSEQITGPTSIGINWATRFIN